MLVSLAVRGSILGRCGVVVLMLVYMVAVAWVMCRTTMELFFKVVRSEDGYFDEKELAGDTMGIGVVEYSPDGDLYR